MIQELKEGQWVMVHGSMGELVLEYNKIERRQFKMEHVSALDLDDLVDCFRGWVQKVQLLSMDTNTMN